MEGNPLVSVIITNYNYGRFIGDAIHSVLSQTHSDLELVIVDDGSTDNSREVIEGFDDTRIKKLFQENKGQAEAFNTGYVHAEGDIIAFLDSDDWWTPEKLEVVVDAFRHNNVSLVQHNLWAVDELRKKISLLKLKPPLIPGKFDLIQNYIKHNHIEFFAPTSGLSSRKVYLDKIFPLDTQWKICADVLLRAPLPFFGDVLNLEQILGYYRFHGRNYWSFSDTPKNFIENQEKYNEYINYWFARLGYKERIDVKKHSKYYIWKFLEWIRK